MLSAKPVQWPLLAIGLVVVVGSVLLIWSWRATFYEAVGHVPDGYWVFQVQSTDGSPIRGARITIRSLDNRRGELPFDNCRDGSRPMFTDSNGLAYLKLEDTVIRFSESGWRVLWIWPVHRGGPPLYEIMFAALGHQERRITTEQLFDQSGTVTITLP